MPVRKRAVAKRTGLTFKDLRGEFYFSFRTDLLIVKPILRKLFKSARRYEKERYSTLHNLARLGPKEMWDSAARKGVPVDKWLDTVGASGEAPVIFAGVLAIVLVNLMKGLKQNFRADTEWAALSKTKYGYTTFQILSACANNFRHTVEWGRRVKRYSKLDKRQVQNVKILYAVLGGVKGRTNLNSFRLPNVSWHVISKLSDGNYRRLEAMVKALGDELVRRCNVPESILLEAARSL